MLTPPPTKAYRLEVSIEETMPGHFFWVISARDPVTKSVRIFDSSIRSLPTREAAQAKAMEVIMATHRKDAEVFYRALAEVRLLDTVPGSI